MNKTLKPCPFCGEPANIKEVLAPLRTDAGYFYIKCCLITTRNHPFGDADESKWKARRTLTHLWNMRF